MTHYPPSPKVGLPGHFDVKVVGLSFTPGYPENLHRLAHQKEVLGVNWELELHREPANPYDANAVAVRVTSDQDHLGHLPAALAGRIAPEMDAGTSWRIVEWRVLVMPGKEENPGLSLKLVRVEP